MSLQYIPQSMKSRGADRFAIIMSIGIVWAFAEILTAAGAYNKRSQKTQLSCRTDRSGLISAAPWLVLSILRLFLTNMLCLKTMNE